MIHPPAPVCDFESALVAARQFLLAIANADLPPELRAKGGASDLVQDTLTAALRARHQFVGRTEAELRGWLRKILVRELGMLRRKFQDTASRDVSREAGVPTDDLVEAAIGPTDALARRESHARVAAAVARLPRDERRVVLLRVEGGLGFAAIGQQLGQSESTARALFARALELLRAALPADC